MCKNNFALEMQQYFPKKNKKKTVPSNASSP